jgi:LAO/AO transport system ATPase
MSLSFDDLARRLAAGERPALARALSLAERDPAAGASLVARLADKLGRAHVVGITGPPGAGKSTLVGVMVRQMLQLGRRVAVLAVDPSSPVTGGALLGDRFRIGEGAADDRSFIRSTATRGSLGGLTAAAQQMVQMMDAAGYDLVLVETVGTGQSEIDVARLADSLLVVFPPGLGDELQAIKAGILELADLLVITKSDTAAAAQAAQSLRTAAHMWRKAPPIHSVSALSGEGIVQLTEAVLARARLPRQARDTPATPARPSLAACFEKLRDELERRLPADWSGSLSMRALHAASGAQDGRLSVECSLQPGGEAFQLGAAAAGLTLLAADIGLDCVVEQRDAAGSTMHLVFRYAP